jgi:nitrite reductase/ring-hydroxylating ferredoxin subunit
VATIPADLPTVQQILDGDAGKPAPAPFREQSPKSFPLSSVPVEHYTSREFLELEYTHLWSKVWQWAANEEDIREVGDYVVYDIGDESIIVIRTAPDVIKAFHNACLHRGRALIDKPDGHRRRLTCNFHGWSWNLDGTLDSLPCEWDFPELRKADLRLPEVRLETWAGFIFINLDPDAGPLHEHLDIVPEHFEHFPLDQRFTALHIRKVMPANWKVVLEAFLESYHVPRTHATMNKFIADVNTQYDIWNTSSRMHSPMGVPSPGLGHVEPEVTYRAAKAYFSGPISDAGADELPEGMTPRDGLASIMRTVMRASAGIDISEHSTSEIVDAVQYFVFPNWCPWAGIANPFQYRFLPNGHDPDSSLFDIRMMFPLPPGAQRPPSPPVRHVGIDEGLSTVPELFAMGPLFDQDVDNIGPMQRGLKATRRKVVHLSEIQESRVRHFHTLLRDRLGI